MIAKIVVGVLQANCYIVWDEKTKETIVIDPGGNGEIIADYIDKNNLKPILIVNTHHHFDHTGANRYLKSRYNIPIAIGKFDARLLEKSHIAALELMIKSEPSPKADILLSEGDKIVVGKYIFNVIETPGHTRGSICLYSNKEKILFSGDTLFFESIGRWDLESGDKKEILKSLNKILALEENVVVYPGHGRKTSVKHELKHNPYKKGAL